MRSATIGLTVWTLCAFAAAALAQGPTASDKFDIERAGEFIIEKDGLWRFEGGIRAAVRFADPARGVMNIRADRGSGAPSSDGSSYSKVILEGGVVIESNQGRVTSQRAELDMAKEEAVFTGAVKGSLPQVKSFQCDKLIYNFKTGQTRLTNATAQGLGGPTQSGAVADKPEEAWLLSAGDVQDWPKLLKTLKEQSAAAAPSPGKHIMGMLKPEERQGLGQMPTAEAPGPQNQKLIIGVLNRVLRQAAFYDAAAWKGVARDDATNALLEKKAKAPLSPVETAELNRRLFQTAFAGAVAAKNS